MQDHQRRKTVGIRCSDRFCISFINLLRCCSCAFINVQTAEKCARRAFLRPEAVHQYRERAKKVRGDEEKGRNSTFRPFFIYSLILLRRRSCAFLGSLKSDSALCHHCICNLKEACNVCTCNKVITKAVLFSSCC